MPTIKPEQYDEIGFNNVTTNETTPTTIYIKDYLYIFIIIIILTATGKMVSVLIVNLSVGISL